MRKHLFILGYLITLTSMFACSSGTLIDQSLDMEQGYWHVDSLASFSYEIEDTTQNYDISYLVRYAADYPYYNLYVTYYLEDSVGTILQSEQQELILFDKKTGKPLGEGVGDLFDRKVKIFSDYQYDQAMTYQFKIKHYMRTQKLPGIMSFGLKIENAKE